MNFEFISPGIEPRFIETRTAYKSRGLLNKKIDKEEDPMSGRDETTYADANLISSRSYMDHNIHLPVLDIDFPAHLEPSTTAGHFHLYLNREIEWDKYVVLLSALHDAGIIETGFYEMSLARGATFVRKPGVLKKEGEFSSGSSDS